MVRAAHGEHGGAGRKALVEDVDLGVEITTELQRDQRQQHRLARARRADDHHVADIADVRRKPERRRAPGLRRQQRRAIEMSIARGSCPDTRQRHEVRQVQGVDDGLADIGVGMAGKRRQPRLHGVDAFADGREAQATGDPLDLPDLVLD